MVSLGNLSVRTKVLIHSDNMINSITDLPLQISVVFVYVEVVAPFTP